MRLKQSTLFPQKNHTPPKWILPFRPNLNEYDRVLIMFSGGKDSLALLLYLLDSGVPPEKIELWHHLVDGREESVKFKMDWPITEDYCRKIALYFGIPILFSWRIGGFEAEMNRNNSPTNGVRYETFDKKGNIVVATEESSGRNPNTRGLFPQVSANLSVRWCSAYLKIDVCGRVLRNDLRFRDKKVLVVTGERAQESKARSKYKMFEFHGSDLRDGKQYQRHIDHWRPIKRWPETCVWSIIEKHRVQPHPAYVLGWSRCSCFHCIFANKNQRASEQLVSPDRFNAFSKKEKSTGKTVNRDFSVVELADVGTPYEASSNPFWLRLSQSEEFHLPVVVDNWILPAGAFGESHGPS